MSGAALVVLAVLVVAFLLFVTGWLEPDLIAMLVLVGLVLSRVIDPGDAFRGFSSFAVITIAGLMVIGFGLEKTGVVAWVARRLGRIIRERYNRLLLLNTAIPGLLSGIVNIVASASFFIPVILRLCKQMRVSQAKILLPMAATALVGANLTLIGASHNLVVDSLLEGSTGQGFAFFEFTAVGVVLLAATLLYIVVLGQHLLPGEKETPEPTEVPETLDLVDVYELEDRLFEVWFSGELEEGGTLTLGDVGLPGHGLTLIAAVREGELLVIPGPEMDLVPGDVLLLQGREKRVEAFADDHHLLTFIGPPKSQEKYPLSTAELAEAVVPPRSPVLGQTVEELDMPRAFGMTVIAYYREGQPHRTGVQEVELQEGDSLLVYGPRDRMREFHPEKELLIYFKPGEPEISTKMKKKAPLAAAILLLVVLVAALDWFPIPVTAVAGAVAMILLGIVPLARVYEAIDWKTLVLIAGMYPLGVALNQTGAADAVGRVLLAGLGGLGPLAVMGGVALLCMILTQAIHNAAVAIIMTPVAIQASELMGSSPTGFCVAVVVSCSAAFLMPYGHPAPYLVRDPGGYEAGDYLKFGAGLNVLTLAVILTVVPALWPLSSDSPGPESSPDLQSLHRPLPVQDHLEFVSTGQVDETGGGEGEVGLRRVLPQSGQEMIILHGDGNLHVHPLEGVGPLDPVQEGLIQAHHVHLPGKGSGPAVAPGGGLDDLHGQEGSLVSVRHDHGPFSFVHEGDELGLEAVVRPPVGEAGGFPVRDGEPETPFSRPRG